MKNLEELRVVDLRNELEKRGLDKSGVKAILLERLKKAILDEGQSPEDVEVKGPITINESENRENYEGDTSTGNKTLNESIVSELVNEDPLKDPGETFDFQEPEENCQNNEQDKSFLQDMGQEKKCRELQVDKKVSDELLKREEETLQENKLDSTSEDFIPEQAFTSFEEESDDALKKDEEMVDSTTETSAASSQNKEEGLTLENECPMTREDYVQRMEDDSINLLLEDDDKMLDYEENDRTDMDEAPPADNKGKTDEAAGSCGKIPEESLAGKSDKQSSNKENVQIEKSSCKSNDESAATADEKLDKKQSQSNSGSRNLWVSGLASNTRAQDLKSLFCKHGKVLSAKIVTNAKTPGARCYGFVTMASVADAAKCITHLNRTELHGKMIQVEKAKGEPGGPMKVSPLYPKPSSGSTKESEVITKEDKSAVSKRESEKLKDAKEKIESQRKRKSLSSDRKDKSRNGHDRVKPNRIDRKISSRVVVADDYVHRRSSEDNRRLSAKDRVVDRRHEIRRGSREKRSPPVLSLNRIVEERERHRLKSRGRQDREEERRRRHEEIALKEIERLHKEEAENLRREREKLRLEREKIEQQKQDLIRMEREQQRLERERLERERNELRKQQLKYEEVRRGVKRPSSDHREYFNDRKRGPSRISDRSPERTIVSGPSRSLSRISDKSMPNISGRSREQGHLRGSDRMSSNRGLDRHSDRENRYNDGHRESRYPGNGGSERGANASSNSVRVSGHYDERRDRDREERRPMERSTPRSEDRGDRRTPPPPSLRSGRLPRDNHYNGNPMATDGIVDTWRSPAAPKNASYISNSNIIAGVGGASLGNRGVEVPSNWKPSSAMSTNERWGGNPGNRNANIIDPYRIAGQVPMNSIPMMPNMMQSDRFGQMGSFRK